MTKSRSLVLFDIGAVMLELNYNGFFTAAGSVSGLSLEEIKKQNTAVELDSIAGNIGTQEVLERLGRILGTGRNEAVLMSIIRKCWGQQIDEMVELKERLARKGYMVGLFSNIDEIALEILGKEFPDMFKTFGGPAVYSCRVHSVKPNPEMYKQIIGYDRVVFIDDKESYLNRGIRDFGWKGILFTPYIDPSETIRGVQKSESSGDYTVADSVDAVIKSLQGFDIRI